MRKLWPVLLLLLGMLAACGSTGATPPTPPPPPPPPIHPIVPPVTTHQLYVSKTGKIENSSGASVNLYGYNEGGLYLGNAGVSVAKKGDPVANVAATQREIAAHKAALSHVNLVRVAYNAYWWNTNVYVPDAGMHFRQWLQDRVAWETAVGNYVILDRTAQFFEPPCGNDGKGYVVTFCPAQDQAGKDGKLAERMDNMATAKTAITDLSKLYATNSMVEQEVWNEPTSKQVSNEATYFSDMKALLSIVQQYDPNALKFVYVYGYKDIQSGLYPDFTQPNIIVALHIYDGFSGSRPWDKKACSEPGSGIFSPDYALWNFIQARGHGLSIDEWGGCYNLPAYNAQLMSAVKKYGASSAYFDVYTLFNPDGTLNPNGIALAKDYA